MKSKFLYFFKWLIFLSAAFLSAGLIYGLGTQQTGHQTTSTLQTIDYYDSCTAVRHNGSSSYFVPTKTLAEWTSFKNNLPSDVSLENSGSGSVISSGTITSQQSTFGGGNDMGVSQTYRGYYKIVDQRYGSKSGFSTSPVIIDDFYTVTAIDASGWGGVITTITGNYEYSLPPFESFSFNGVLYSLDDALNFPTYDSDSNQTGFTFQRTGNAYENFDPNGTPLPLSFNEMCSTFSPKNSSATGVGCGSCPSGVQTITVDGTFELRFCNLSSGNYGANSSDSVLRQDNSIRQSSGIYTTGSGAACSLNDISNGTEYSVYRWRIFNNCSSTLGPYCE